MNDQIFPPFHQSLSAAFFPSLLAPALSGLIQTHNGCLSGLLASSLLFSQSPAKPCLHYVPVLILSSSWLLSGRNSTVQPEIQVLQHLYLSMIILYHFLTQELHLSQCCLFILSPRKFLPFFFFFASGLLLMPFFSLIIISYLRPACPKPSLTVQLKSYHLCEIFFALFKFKMSLLPILCSIYCLYYSFNIYRLLSYYGSLVLSLFIIFTL